MKYVWAFLSLAATAVPAECGDAVVAGYNKQGAWTSVTYYCSSTPKGGTDYKDAADARETALRDLKRRGGDEVGRPTVIASSDRTGNFAVARGKAASGRESVVVGYGKSEREAELAARDKLKAAGATANQTVMYRYHSYGSDSAPSR